MGAGAVVLRGPWDRYEGKLPEEALATAPVREVMFPLRSRIPNSEALSIDKAMTYRVKLRIEGGSVSQRMALFVPAGAGLDAAYIGSEKIYDAAQDSTIPATIAFNAPSGEFSVILQTAPGARGFDKSSSFPSFVLFGDTQSVSVARIKLDAGASALTGSFILIGLFVLVLFVFFQGKHRDFLAFAIYMLVAGLYFAFEKSEMLWHILPFGAFASLEGVRLVALDLQYIALAFFLHMLYRKRIKFLTALPFYAMPTLLAAGSLALTGFSPLVYDATAAYCSLFGVAAIAYLAFRLAKGDELARWLLPAIVVVPAALAFSRFGPESVWNACFSIQLGVTIFGIVCALMLMKKVADTFASEQVLSDYVVSFSRTVKRFIPKEFLEHLHKADLNDLKLGDHTKEEMTIFFSDIRAFTELSEGLTVEENFAFINSYLSRVVPLIQENGGFVDKYVGDGIMALFAGDKGPDNAIRTAIAMQGKMVEYNGHRAKMGYRPISTGVGIHTGDLMLGVVGVNERMENTVISDAVNLSSRLQSITKAFNISLAISEQAFKELEDPGSYKYRFIGKVKVKGKVAPVSVFEIFDGIEADLFERKMKANMFFEQGMLSYYQKDFGGAMYYFKRVLDIIPEDGAAGFYLENCMNKASSAI
jgi:two-component system sensor histidine kinase ChiS